jgi:putative endonuclease
VDDWYIYVVRCNDDSLYTGITTDVERRLAEHESGRGAKALRARGPLRLELQVPVGSRGAALRVEARIKRLRKAQTERLLGDAESLRELIETARGQGLA